ncbi:BCCT family transporter [Halalkalibacter hemicellulosilyticus]|uniref:Glycine betaine transporter OpuD n=1 Tax=Halalkalibacter hemicellulosilyticusJCM 9152 TaxID=1236971 RepID=W4QF87_9BACI|nr:BCCT family transporter [Halalkalibacter hemicellulosilyticus]GAE30765.1 glycine betaine transporter OpuD [Halalkalibacter hemicellulosilyticusJCM 9152]
MNDQRIVDKEKVSSVLLISAIIVGLFVLWGALSPNTLNRAANEGLDWMLVNFGWFYMLVTAFFVVFVIILAISPYGKVRLGDPNEKPEYSWYSWIGMLFAAGIGVGFVFWGVAEPVLYYLDPPMGYTAETSAAAVAGLRYAVYHWALHPWAIFSIVGLTLAYVQFRKNRPALISSAFYPLIGDRVNGWFGRSIDILAVIATCTGVATTFGLSALQITGGLSYISAIPNNVWTQITIIAIVTVLFMFSAAKGLDKGIKRLSNINLAVAGLLLLFVIVVGPTLFIAESIVTTLGGYITNVAEMSLTMTPFAESGWLGRNTIFFWAWHIAWAPFMGIFIARISRGRTIREFMAGVLLVPSLLAVIWFTSFGGTALNIEIAGSVPIGEMVTDNVEIALFATLGELPLSMITSFLAVILILIFFITSADSASYVLGTMTSKGSLNPGLMVKMLWGILIAGTASVLLISGDGGLGALQTASIIAALPFAIIMAFMIISVLIMIGRDYSKENVKRRRRRQKKMSEEIKDDLYDDLKEDVYEQVKEEVREDVYEQVKEEVREDIYEQVKEELYEELNEDSDSMK